MVYPLLYVFLAGLAYLTAVLLCKTAYEDETWLTSSLFPFKVLMALVIIMMAFASVPLGPLWTWWEKRHH